LVQPSFGQPAAPRLRNALVEKAPQPLGCEALSPHHQRRHGKPGARYPASGGELVMSFWCAAQLQPQRDGLALHCLKQAGFETYAPRLREHRTVHGRKVTRTPLLFPGYLFALIELQWSRARWSPGVVRLIMDGLVPRSFRIL
jgi:transcription termination factor NusG